MPHVTLMTNDYKTKGQISRFVRYACSAGGPFSGTIQTLKTGGKMRSNHKNANVKMDRDMPSVPSHLLILEEPFEITATTEIQY